MTTDNRALWELVEKWRAESRSCGMGGFAELSAFHEIAADELAALLRENSFYGDEDERNCDVCGSPVMYGDRHHKCGDSIMRAEKSARDQAILERPVVVGDDSPSDHMRLAVALDFADNPRPYHTLQAPADTNGELYEALRVLAAAYRGLTSGPKEAMK